MDALRQIQRIVTPEKSLAFERVSCTYGGGTDRLLAQFHGDWSEDEMAGIERVLLERLEQDSSYWVLCKFDPINKEPYNARLATWEFWHYERGSADSLARAIQSNSSWIGTPPEERAGNQPDPLI